MGVLLEGLKEEYVRIKRGVESIQKPPAFGYIDYAHWQNKMLESGAWEDQFIYWKKKLESLPEPLPSGRLKACGSDFAQARREWWLIPEHNAIRTKAKARESTTSVFVIMLSAWFLLLKKIYGQTHLIVTTPFANRNIPEVEKMTGYFTNMLVLRAFVNDNQKTDDLLNETSKMCLEAFSNSAYPFGNLIKRLGYNFPVDKNPLLQIQFIMQNWNLPDLSFDGITLSQKEVGNNTAKAGLAMNVDQTGKGLECWIEYPEECFFLEEIRKMVNDYNEILVQVIDNPEKTVGEIISSQSVTAMKPVYLTGEGNLLIKCAEILLENNWKTVGIISDDFQTINSAKARQIEAFSTHDGFWLLEEIHQPHFLFSINNDNIIPGYILSNQFLTVINYHNSLLPAYAGLFATSWAIMHNEKTHGITWHKVTEKIDAGDVYVQQSFEIGDTDTAGVLNLRSFEAAIEGFRKLLNLTRSNDFNPQPQNLVQRSYFGRYMRPDYACLINFNHPASEIERFCRACNLGWQHYNDFGLPRLIISGDLYLVPEVKVIPCNSTVLPGIILDINALGIEVATAENAVRIPSFMGIDGSIVLPENIAQKHNIIVGKAISTANDQLLSTGEKKPFRQIISNENFWLNQLLEYQPIVFPIFPSKKQESTYTEIADDRLIHIEMVCENLVKNQPTEEAPLIIAQAVALFLAKLTDQSSIVLPVAFDNPVSQLVYPFVPVTFSFDKQESFIGQKDQLLQNLLSFKEKSGFFSDLFVRHPELKQKLKGSRLYDSNLAIVFQKGNSNSYTPMPGAATHIVIGNNSLSVVFPSISDHDITTEVSYLQTHLQHFISRLINPETPVCRLHLLTPDEWEEMIVKPGWFRLASTSLGNHRSTTGWSDNLEETIVKPGTLVKETDDNFTVLDLFNEQVKKSPSSIAVKHVGQEITYGQLDEMVSAAAKQLINHKFLPGSVAAIMAERSPALIAAMLGILKAGGAYLPLDASFPEARLDEIISGAGIRFAFVTKTTKPLLEGKIEHLLSIENLSDPGSVLPPELADSSGTAYIIYTSGSTGQPKGVVVPHKALLAFTRSAIERYHIVPADKVLQFASLTFDTAVEEIFTTLCIGATLVLRTNEVAGSVTALLQLLQSENISVLDLPTAFWQQAISTMISEGLKFPDSIRLVIIGGEAVQIDAVNLWRKYFINGPRLINTYGPTETTVVATSCYLDEEEITTSFPIGKPMGNTTVFVVDSDYNPVLPVMKGQLAIGGPQVATKYLGDPALTNQKFIPDVFSNNPSNRIYLTGDLVTRNRYRSLIYLGRIDKQVKIRGFRVEPEEIDRVLALSGFTTSSITVMKETNQVKRLVSYVIPKSAQVDIKTILHKYLVQRLPEYMIPAAIVPLSALPFNKNMKVDQSALPLPQFDDDQTDENPLTPTENQLAGLFIKILKIDRCNTKTSFFELGGDSLLSLALVSGIKQLFDYEISVAAIYENPSIQKLALFIENEKEPSTGVYKPSDLGNQITCLNEGGNLPPIFTIFLDAANGWLPGLLSKQQPLFTFIPEGSDGEKIKHCTVPTMASFYVDSMLKLFPAKPVHLIGYSFGGLVALEMAIQLQNINIPPLSLTLIDTVAPQIWKTLINQIDLRSKVNHTLANLKREVILRSGKNIPPSLRNGYILHTWRKAAYHYSPIPVKDSIKFYLIRSKESLSEKPLLGWEEWPVFTPEVTMFDSDHHSIIRHKEKVIQLAEWMKDKLF